MFDKQQIDDDFTFLLKSEYSDLLMYMTNNNPLEWAAKGGMETTLVYLLKNDISISNDKIRNAIKVAVKHKNFNIVKILVSRTPKLNNVSAIEIAIEQLDTKMVSFLIRNSLGFTKRDRLVIVNQALSTNAMNIIVCVVSLIDNIQWSKSYETIMRYCDISILDYLLDNHIQDPFKTMREEKNQCHILSMAAQVGCEEKIAYLMKRHMLECPAWNWNTDGKNAITNMKTVYRSNTGRDLYL